MLCILQLGPKCVQERRKVNLAREPCTVASAALGSVTGFASSYLNVAPVVPVVAKLLVKRHDLFHVVLFVFKKPEGHKRHHAH